MSESQPQIVRRGVVAVVRQADRFLVIRRSEFVTAPGTLCFPGGGIEAGESETEALCRELIEELGCGVRPVARLWHSVTPSKVHLAWWHAEMASPLPLSPNPAEVAEVHWMTAAEMHAAPLLLESNRQFLKAWQTGVFAIE